MTDISANNKRIAKNTLFLYIRMLFIMAVQLYTSRVVLNVLGVVDYGLYNVVGGVVTMFAFLNGAMITSTQRYITFEIGRGDTERLKTVFSTCLQIHLLLSVFIVILAETVGLWFFYEKMIIPADRFTAAMWVYQVSILTMIVQVMSVPYNSDIVAHERMGVFAVISVAEAVLKLAVVYALLIYSSDKLVMYAIMVAAVQILIRCLYTWYCKRNFMETHIVRVFDRSLIKEMGKFVGWNIWGNLASVLYGTGLNLLLNMFFGPIVNAARAIAVQVETAISQFSSNFMMAVNPQITKLYAQDNLKEMHNLLFRASKVTFFLMLALSLPVMMETGNILQLWLKIVPEYTVIFLRLLLVIVVIESVSRPLMTSAAATGNVKLYQSLVGGILLSIVPISYIVLKLGCSPVSVYIVQLCVYVVAFMARLCVIRPMIRLSIRDYFMQVVMRCLYVSVLSVVIALAFKSVLPNDIVSTFAVCFFSFVAVVLASYLCGLNHSERIVVSNKIKLLIARIR